MKTSYNFLCTLCQWMVSLLLVVNLAGQATDITGTLLEKGGDPIAYANVTLLSTADSSMVKASYTDDNGQFILNAIPKGSYFVEATYLGLKSWRSEVLHVSEISVVIPPVIMEEEDHMMSEVIISGQRPIIEVKPDRTVFNVQGTINASGDNGLELLRKAPGLVLDNNDNIIMMGRSGVLIYVDGKQLMLTGDDRTNYLQNLTAEQIDRIDIITNPGSKYDAQGNAGIIDIRLKKDKNLGYNGTLTSTYSQGRYGRGNLNANGNYRNKKLNIFGAAGSGMGNNWHRMEFTNLQNGLILNEKHNNRGTFKNANFRAGADWFINSNSTIGVLVSGVGNDYEQDGSAINRISNQESPDVIDSILVAENLGFSNRRQMTYNINYVQKFEHGNMNVDLDYGTFRKIAETDQPNRYFNPNMEELLTEVLTFYMTPSDIDIATAKIDYETALWGGQLMTGSKFSKVVTDNTFLFFNIPDGDRIQDNKRSNRFTYDEQVTAAYLNYARPLDEKFSFSAGLRVEHTDAVGELTAFVQELEEDPVVFNYVNWFPSMGITYSASKNHAYALNYSKRINRPDYKVLNPFREQASELAFSKGNPFLQPEIADNLELNYTFKHMYNFKLAYSHTSNKITRLVSPDAEDPRAGFITWDNLNTQRIYGANIAFPVSITKWWDGYFNINASYIQNRAEYENGSTIDLNAFHYHIFQQQTFSLPGKFKAEFSGWYSGPGIWEGILVTDPNFAINVGIQRKFWDNKINIRLNASDIFFTSQWSGVMNFNGLVGDINGAWDSRRINLSISYDFGNKNVKVRKRQTGLEEESKRANE